MLNDLYEYIKKFFDAGVITHIPSKQRDLCSPEKTTAPKSLFEHMTSGRGAEIRAQQALFPYLLAKYRQTQREVRFGRTRIDFVIPGIEGYDVAIEMKHYSPHQSGKFKALLGPSIGRNFTIIGDLKKPRPRRMILLQIALYTVVEKVDNVHPKKSNVAFVRTYITKGVTQSQYEPQARIDLSKWRYLESYYTPTGKATSADFVVPRVQHAFGSNIDKVSGRVCFFMAFARPGRRL